jgi:hypothetical protein
VWLARWRPSLVLSGRSFQLASNVSSSSLRAQGSRFSHSSKFTPPEHHFAYHGIEYSDRRSEFHRLKSRDRSNGQCTKLFRLHSCVVYLPGSSHGTFTTYHRCCQAVVTCSLDSRNLQSRQLSHIGLRRLIQQNGGSTRSTKKLSSSPVNIDQVISITMLTIIISFPSRWQMSSGDTFLQHGRCK